MSKRLLFVFIVIGALAGLGYYLYRSFRPSIGRTSNLMEWFRNPQAHPDWAMQAGTRCGSAPFIIPTDGFIGYLPKAYSVGRLIQGRPSASGH